MLQNLFCANIYLNAGNENITKKLLFIDAHSSKLEKNIHPSCIWLLLIRSNALSTSLLRFYGILSHRLGIQRTTATKRTTIETLKLCSRAARAILAMFSFQCHPICFILHFSLPHTLISCLECKTRPDSIISAQNHFQHIISLAINTFLILGNVCCLSSFLIIYSWCLWINIYCQDQMFLVKANLAYSAFFVSVSGNELEYILDMEIVLYFAYIILHLNSMAIQVTYRKLSMTGILPAKFKNQ